MNDSIIINVERIDAIKQDLKELAQECQSLAVKTPPKEIGGGKAIIKLRMIERKQNQMAEDTIWMINSTIGFLQYMKTHVENVDESLSSKLQKMDLK